MANFDTQISDLLDRYVDEVNSDPASTEEIADWILENRLYSPPPRDVKKILKDLLSDRLRQQKRFDGKRWYRAKRSVRTNIGGVQINLWADVDKNASFGFMEKSVAQSRRAIADDAYQLKMVVDHYNEANSEGRQLSLILDFSDDVAEMEASTSHPEEDAA